jgi:hypothetical protein
MKTPQPSCLTALAVGILGIATSAQADLITTIPDLPPLGGVYLSTDVHQIFGGPALEFILSLPQHKVIVDELKLKQGTDQQETFFSTLDANLEVKQNGITVQNGPIQANGLATTVVHNRYNGLGVEQTTGTFQTEMLSLNLSGGTLPPGVMIRESPTLASLGITTTTDLGGGLYKIDSFFDVFTELSIDGGQTWMPSTSGPGHVTLVPEPTSLSLLAAGFAGMMGCVRRRR